MRPRLVNELIRRNLARYPAVALVGPRQCGKTTLARACEGRYYDLEVEPDRLRLDLDWQELARGDALVILDEAQAWPEVFPRLRHSIDAERRRNGRFLLLGSVSPALMREVSDSLAGRLSLVELTPFLTRELADVDLDRLWLMGGYPDGGVLGSDAYPQWQRNYTALLSLRDLPAWGLPSKPDTTQRLMRMLAALHGQRWNASQVGKSLGLNYQTVNSYLEYLQGAFLIRRLPPYQSNVRKRLVKSPKLYWRDTGVLHGLHNVPDRDTLLAQPWVGASWEGFVIEQVLGHLAATGRSCEAYCFRTSDGHEVDLVLDFGTAIWALETKLTSSPTRADMRRLAAVMPMIGAARGFLVCRAAEAMGEGELMCADLRTALQELLNGG